MKASGILLALLVVMTITLSSNAAEKGYKKILGVWEFTAPSAPQPYDSGLLTLKVVNQKLTGEFTIQGQVMPIPQSEFADNLLTLSFEVENTPIILKLKLTNEVMEGTTDSPNGPVKVTVKRAKKVVK